MKLLLIRHGLSLGNAEGRLQGQYDSPLVEQGRQQARALAHRLVREERSVSAVYTSDLSRASETAEIIAGSLQAPVLRDRRLREYDFGSLNGVIWNEVEALYPDIWKAYHLDAERVPIPLEEGAQAFHDRLAEALHDIRTRHEAPGKAVAVITHGGSLGMMMIHLLRMEIRRPSPFRFDNASLTVVEYSSRGTLLTRMNDVCHLDGGGSPACTEQLVR